MAHEVGQTTVGKGDVVPAVEYDDFRVLVQPAQARRAGGAARDASEITTRFFVMISRGYALG
jgi:hypothetical protein